MSTPMPEQRPALRRAADRDRHPVTPPPTDDLRVTAGSATADAVRAPRREKSVKLSVKVPKSLRTALREEAERRSMPVDELVAILLGDRITR